MKAQIEQSPPSPLSQSQRRENGDERLARGFLLHPAQLSKKIDKKGWFRKHPFLVSLMAYVAIALCFGHGENGYTFNMGERIRQGGELRTGVDVNRPCGNRYYVHQMSNGEMDHYVQAPEVSYRPQISFVAIDDIDYAVNDSTYILGGWLGIPYHSQIAALDIQPTGRILNAKVGIITTIQFDSNGVTNRKDKFVFHEQVHTLPFSVKECLLSEQSAETTADDLGTLTVTVYPSDWRRIAAVPFDYVVSPILNFTCTLIDSVVSFVISVVR